MSFNRYFPKGGGSCRISTNPLREIKATEIVDFGEVRKLFGWSFVAGTLPIKVSQRNVFNHVILISFDFFLIFSWPTKWQMVPKQLSDVFNTINH